MRLSTYFDSFGLTKAMQKQSIRFGAIYYKSWWNSWIPEYLEESRVERGERGRGRRRRRMEKTEDEKGERKEESELEGGGERGRGRRTRVN